MSRHAVPLGRLVVDKRAARVVERKKAAFDLTSAEADTLRLHEVGKTVRQIAEIRGVRLATARLVLTLALTKQRTARAACLPLPARKDP